MKLGYFHYVSVLVQGGQGIFRIVTEIDIVRNYGEVL
jgi:hypothetical protein